MMIAEDGESEFEDPVTNSSTTPVSTVNQGDYVTVPGKTRSASFADSNTCSCESECSNSLVTLL